MSASSKKPTSWLLMLAFTLSAIAVLLVSITMMIIESTVVAFWPKAENETSDSPINLGRDISLTD